MTVVSLRGTWVPSAGVSPWLAARDIAAITRRNLRRILRTLQFLLIAAVQPSILLAASKSRTV